MKKFAAIALAASMVLGLSGCGSSGSAQTSDTATAENPMVLTLAHGLSESHTVHIAMTEKLFSAGYSSVYPGRKYYE